MKIYRNENIFKAVRKSYENEFSQYRVSHYDYCFEAWKTDDGFIGIESKTVENKVERIVIVFDGEQALVGRLAAVFSSLYSGKESVNA